MEMILIACWGTVAYETCSPRTRRNPLNAIHTNSDNQRRTGTAHTPWTKSSMDTHRNRPNRGRGESEKVPVGTQTGQYPPRHRRPNADDLIHVM